MTLPAIIGLNGVARAGKDTVATILHDLYGYEIVSFSDMLNKALYTLDREVGRGDAGLFVKADIEGQRFVRYADLVDEVGYEAAKEVTGVRRALQVMGTEVGRNLLGENIWVEALFNNLPKGLVVITNVRFPNEYAKVRSRHGALWRITRPGFEPALGHISDTALDGHIFDRVIENNSSVPALADKIIDILAGNPVNFAINQGVRA